MGTTITPMIQCSSLGEGSVLRVDNCKAGARPIDLDVEQVKEMFRGHAAVVFSGFDGDLNDFRSFSDQFCTDWMRYQGGAHNRVVLGSEDSAPVYSVNIYLGNDTQHMWELPMHSDMSYQGYRPEALFFYCIHPARGGGETALCDGKTVYQKLSPETRDFFLSNRIRYIRTGDWRVRFNTDNLEEVKKWCRDSGLAYSYDAATDVVTSEFITDAVYKDMRGDMVFCNSILPVLWQEDEGFDKSLIRTEDGSKLPDSVINDIREVTSSERVLVKMKAGDMMWVDNTRTLHGRMKFDDPDRNVAIRMASRINW